MLGPVAGGLIVGYFQWRVIFFVNLPIGMLVYSPMVYRHLPDYRAEDTHPLDVVGLILFGSGVALLSYVLEVFGEHTLGWRVMLGLLANSAVLLSSYGIRATRTEFPLLRLALFRIRSFRAAVSGCYFTLLGIGGFPLVFPLLYQVGLGFTPIQSGLLMMPQAIAAMSLKLTMPQHPETVWLSERVDFKHGNSRIAYLFVCDNRGRYAGMADCHPGLCVRVLYLAAIHEHEHTCLR